MKLKIHKHLHRRILTQLVIIATVALILFVMVGFDALSGAIGFLPVTIAAAIGIAVGYLAGRMFLVIWHEDTKKIIMRMDKTSFILIGLYIAFRIFSTQLLGGYFNGAALSAISFAALDGILVGRLLSLWRNIARILREQGIIRGTK
jgi:hypothetical protein